MGYLDNISATPTIFLACFGKLMYLSLKLILVPPSRVDSQNKEKICRLNQTLKNDYNF